MAKDTSLLSGAFSFVLHSGKEVFPVRMRSRKTGLSSFRVSPGGTGGNKLEATEQVDEARMISRVLVDKYAVRCISLDGEVNGQYKPDGPSVSHVKPYSQRPFL